MIIVPSCSVIAFKSCPTLILFQNGEEKDRMIGVAIKEAVARTIDAHMGAASN